MFAVAFLSCFLSTQKEVFNLGHLGPTWGYAIGSVLTGGSIAIQKWWDLQHFYVNQHWWYKIIMITFYHMFFFPVTKENIHLYVSLGELKKTSMSKSGVDFRPCPADQDSAAVVWPLGKTLRNLSCVMDFHPFSHQNHSKPNHFIRKTIGM